MQTDSRNVHSFCEVSLSKVATIPLKALKKLLLLTVKIKKQKKKQTKKRLKNKRSKMLPHSHHNIVQRNIDEAEIELCLCSVLQSTWHFYFSMFRYSHMELNT